MEDTDGNYPVHLACANGASIEVIQTLIGRYPRAALLLNPNDDLPLHCLLSDEAFRDPASIREKVRVMLPPLLAAPHALHTPDSRYGMMPLHIMVYFQAAEYADLLKLRVGRAFCQSHLGQCRPPSLQSARFARNESPR
jgi:ankyrin repeat protein